MQQTLVDTMMIEKAQQAIIFKLKNHFSEIRRDVVMSPREKEGEQEDVYTKTGTHSQPHPYTFVCCYKSVPELASAYKPIPTSLFVAIKIPLINKVSIMVSTVFHQQTTETCRKETKM